jgi:hypothetical protein
MPPAAIPPSSNGLQTQADTSRDTDDLSPVTRLHGRPCKGSKASCEMLIRHSTNTELQRCGRVVARLCDNQLCKRHCECKGGCQLHPSGLGPDLECAAGSLSLRGQDGACATPEQPETFNYVSADDIILPIPPRIPDQLDAQEQKDIASALARSLEPVSHASYLYPMNSYDSALGLMHSNSSSNSTSSMGPTQSLDTGSSIPVSATEAPSASAFSSNMHLRHFTPVSSTSHTQLPFKPAATTTPPVAAETSRDRAAKRAQDIQSTSNKLPVASIDARLSRQMHGAWLNQFEARDASLVQVINDEAAQKALELRCQRQFVLKFFRAVS